MTRLIQLLLDAPLSEHRLVFQDAAWTLLAGARSMLQSADAGSKRQKVCTHSSYYDHHLDCATGELQVLKCRSAAALLMMHAQQGQGSVNADSPQGLTG